MSVAEIKKEIEGLEAAELDEVAALVLQLRRMRDPERKENLAELVDGNEWVSWRKDDGQ